MKKFYFLTLLTIVSFVKILNGQTTTIDNTIGTTNYTGGNGVTGISCVTFVIENNSGADILLTQVGSYFLAASNNTNVALWYSSSSLSGPPTIASPTWNQITTAGPISIPATGVYDLFSGLSFTIPNGTQYRFALQSSINIRYSGATPVPSPSTLTAGGVSLKGGDVQIAGANVGYGGAFPTPPSANSPRWFTGRISFMPAAACTSPPDPGTVTTTANIVCSSENFTLGLTGGTGGVGQTYQWQSSPDSIAWSNITGATLAALTTSQSTTSYYRCRVTCGGNTVNSAGLKIVSPVLVSGSFTINSAQPTGGSNFQNFMDALNYIKCGIGGPVIFDVAPGSGPYNEQVIIPEIGGVSSVNTITFNGNGAIVSDNSAAVTGERAVFKLNGADYVTLNNFVINTGAGTYGYGIQLLNDADNNTISNCTINNNMSSTSTTNYAGILVNSTASAITTAGASLCDNNVITGNTINGGYAGVAIVANSTTSQVFNNKITKNIINDFQEYGIYINGNVGTLIDSNDISRPTRSTLTTFRGIGVVNVSQKTNITRNRLHDPFVGNMSSTAAAFCIYFSSCRTTVGNEDTVANNLIYNVNGATGNHNGLLVTASDNIKFYHNTISLEDVSASCTTCGTRGFYMQTAPFAGLDFRNNIVTINRGGTGPKQIIYFEGTGVTFTSNNNDYYMASTGGTTNEIGFANGTAYPSWPAWQGSGQDNASQSVDPLYTNPGAGNLVPLSSSIDNIGSPVGILNDINGSSRSVATPDPGAYEFNNLSVGLNVGAEALVTPAFSASGCYTGTETVTIRLRNASTSAINFATNPVTITTNVTGAVTQTLVATLNTGSLGAGAFMDVPMTGTLNMQVPGVYTFNAFTALAGDVNNANDAMPVSTRTKTTLDAGTVSAAPPSYCITGGTPTLTASGYVGQSGIAWQQSATSGSGFANIAGANSTPYTVTAPIPQTRYYRLAAICGTETQYSPEVSVMVNNPQVISTTPGTRCGPGNVTMSATANPGENLNWYANSSGGTPLSVGPNYTTSISSNTNFYVSASIGSSGIAGRTSPFTTSTGFNGNDYGLVFDALQSFTLTSVDVYPTSTTAGSITVQLTTSLGTTSVGPFSIPAGSGTTVGGGATPFTLPLNLSIPAGTGLVLKSSAHTGNIIRDNPIGTNFSYPLQIGTVGNIISGWLGGAANANTYYYFYNWQYNAGCESGRTAVLSRVDNCPVPVTLLNFTGEKQNNINKLRWTTTTEVNNAGFELERSADGKNFSKLAFVVSLAENGNSNRTLDYVYYDERPLAGNGYYRLKQVDKDGKTSYSNIVLLRGDKVKEVMITSIYPNPAEKEVNLVITSPNVEKVSLIITDVTGKVVAQSALQLIAGDNLQKLSVSQLAPGTYFIKTVCANGCESAVQKFVRH